LPRKDTEKHGRKNNNKILRKVDEGCGCKTKRVQIERLQWGFPIATALSFNMPTSINEKKKEMTHPTQWMGLKTM
jgi:hypothetical protein